MHRSSGNTAGSTPKGVGGSIRELLAPRRSFRALLALVIGATVLVAAPGPTADAAVPTGFVRQTVASGLDQPISVEFLPNGQALVAEKKGELQLVDPTTIPATPTMWLDLKGNINSGAEKGILDFALDPDFTNNGKFYVYFSAGSPAAFRISAFTDTGTPAGRLASEQVLWTDPSGYTSCCHYGGGMDIGPDGKIWLATGDKFEGAKAQDLSVAEGKIIRINTDGTIPDGTDGWAANPYIDPNDGFLDEIWAYGLRNPFRASWDIASGQFFIGEVGGNSNASWEDLHVSGLDDAGTNYGWPSCEGVAPHTDFPDCDNSPHEDPVFAYPHAGVQGGASISAGELYTAGIYPAEYSGAFFYGDYAREYIHYVTFDAQGTPTDNVFDDDAGLVVGLSVGPDGYLYTTSLTGQLYRYAYTGGANQAPNIINLNANPAVAGIGQQVDFSATVIDPDSASIDLDWDFGDGNGAQSTGTAGPAAESHTYTADGTYNVTLSADDGNTPVTSSPIVVQVGSPPSATISSPADGSGFVAGDLISFSAPPPGAGESYDWEVVFTHNDHTHPVLSGVTGQSGSFNVATSGHDYTSDTGYRITLTVTDSVGLFSTASVDIEPTKTDITIAAVPSGITIDIDGVPRTTPLTLDTVQQFQHALIASPSRCTAGTVHDFVGWSHGEPATHTYVVPATPATLTATYTDTGAPCSASVPVTNGLAMRLTANEGITTTGNEVSTWQDLSGNGNDVTTVGAGPALVVGGLNGNDVVSFDGVDDALGRTGFTGLPTGNSDRTVMTIVKYDSNGWGGFSYGQHKCNKAFGLGLSNNGSLGVQGWCNDVQSAVNGNGTGWMTQAVTMQAGAGSLYRNGSLIESYTTTYDTGTTEIRIGSELDDSPYVDMEIAEILVYDRALNPAELAAVESWAQATYLNAAPTGPVLQVSSPSEGAIVVGTDINVSWTVPAGSQAGDQVEVSLDGGTAVVGALSGGHTFASVAPGPHTVDVVVTDGATPYGNSEASVTRNVVVQSVPPTQVPVTSGLVVDYGGGQNFVTNASGLDGWLDRSGNGNDLSLGGGDPSLSIVTPTGVPAVSFDGSGDKLERVGGLVGLPAGSADRSMFIVAQYNSGKWGGAAYGDNVARKAFGLGVNGPGEFYVNGWSYNANTSVVARGNGWKVHSAVVESNQVTQYDVTTEIASRFRNYETDPQRLVLGNDLGGNYVNADIAAVLIYDRALTPAEHSQVANYLDETYITGPSGPDTTAPVITLTGGSSVAVVQNTPWTDPGYSAIDNVDGDITGSVAVGGDTVDTATLGSYVVTYDVSDAAGNPATQVTRTVTVQTAGADTVPPVITLAGGSSVNVAQNSAWTDPGYTATDNVDGDITGSVVVAGDTVNTAALGSYVITYDVIDSAGNPATQVTRTVTVQAATTSVPVTAGLVLDFSGGPGIDATGNAVTGWQDGSGNGNDVSLTGGDPTLGVTTPTGVSAVSFDGSGDKLERVGGLNGLPAGASDRTMFIVSQYNSGKWGGAIYGNNAAREAFGLGVTGSGKLYTSGWSYNANTSVVARGMGWKVHSSVVDSNSVTQYDLLSQVGIRTRTYETNPQRLVLGNDLGNNYVGADIAAVLIYDRALTPAEHTQVTNYLDQTYLSGPAGPDTVAPVITLTGSSTMNVAQNSVWTDPGYSASDDPDGNITGSVVVGGDSVNTAVPGTYVITYNVSDAAGNPATEVTRSVTVDAPGPDTTPPVITLTGGSSVSVDQNAAWNDPGYSATDNLDGDITGSVVVGGDTVNTATVGQYVVTYDVSDAAGNPAVQATRTVNVTAPAGPLPVTAGLVLELNTANIVSSGNAVTGWTDGSSSGNDLSLGGGDPSLGVLTPNGTAAVNFDKTADKLERVGALTGLPAAAADRTMFVVAQYNSGKWGGVVYGDNAKRMAFGLGVNNSGNLYVNGWGYNASTGTPGIGGGWTVHSAVLESNTVTQFEMSNLIGTTPRVYETDLQRLVIGNDLGNNYVNMDVAAVLIYDRALTPAEHAQVANYLNSTYLS